MIPRLRFAVLLSLAVYAISFAQFSSDRFRGEFRGPSAATFETIQYWTPDTSTTEVVIPYRLSRAFFVLEKQGNTGGPLQAQGEFVIEILDEHNAAVTRNLRPVLIEQGSEPADSESPAMQIQGVMVFALKAGSYTVAVEAKDIASGRSIINRDTKLEVRTISPVEINISPILLVEPPSADASERAEKKFVPFNEGGGAMIGQPGGGLFQVVLPDTTPGMEIHWSLRGRDEFDEDSTEAMTGNTFVESPGMPHAAEAGGSVSVSLEPFRRSQTVYLRLPLEKLHTGSYHLHITVSHAGKRAERASSFRIIWPRRPRSLGDFKLAVDAMQHIASKSEMDQLTSAGSEEAHREFRKFWSKRNPDTTRAFNPIMAEYYRRVDEAIRRYSSANESDGYKSDRGRIFILYGSPTVTNRVMKPNAPPAEIWTYESLKQRFTFSDTNKNGKYILMKAEKY